MKGRPAATQALVERVPRAEGVCLNANTDWREPYVDT
jgi:hypothetical protein